MQLPKEGKLPIVLEMSDGERRIPGHGNKRRRIGDRDVRRTNRGNFKSRFLNHTSSFRNIKNRHATELSKYIWNLKDSKTPHSVSWRILQPCELYSAKTKQCNLCLHEKYLIICQPELCSLNTRKELVSACRHRKKHPLCKR